MKSFKTFMKEGLVDNIKSAIKGGSDAYNRKATRTTISARGIEKKQVKVKDPVETIKGAIKGWKDRVEYDRKRYLKRKKAGEFK